MTLDPKKQFRETTDSKSYAKSVRERREAKAAKKKAVWNFLSGRKRKAARGKKRTDADTKRTDRHGPHRIRGN